MRQRTVLLFALWVWTTAVAASEPQYGPYLDLPNSGWPADPTVREFNGAWYLYPTNSSVSVEAWTSTDLEAWTYRGVVWGPAPAGAWNDTNVWAPDILEQQGSYYLYYAAANMVGVAVGDNPLGPFQDVYDHPLIGNG